MKQDPHLDEMVAFVEVLREDYGEFCDLMYSKNPPEWSPTNYRVVYVEATNQKDENSPTLIAKVTYKYLGQTKV